MPALDLHERIGDLEALVHDLNTRINSLEAQLAGKIKTLAGNEQAIAQAQVEGAPSP